ncbi:hypothetical protein L2719_09910 [Shewanella schlegeliana]|uniref:Uncharacterized protein n=1 Tax=Shewanella schlegeliana TaxID=190308 RepID=A0ABS1SYM6_9GAMM|nr:hypothetical protein [Shewanella schlegeliana]MBL4912632.1 hypothetical protein [Shewanella schlegeliana]MCL1109860.1 hypothetical protein [Shewanella schlegeliana]GIU32700.1 hypothetical protein TUM4433_26030 [Shewanella schlegeliana]
MNIPIMNASDLPATGDYSQMRVKVANRSAVDSHSKQEVSQTNDTVSISAAGHEALASDLGKVLHGGGGLKEVSSEPPEASQEPKKKIDEVIEMLKKQLDELRQALQCLEGDNTEAGAEKRKALELQIGALSAQLTELINQKLEHEKKEQAENAR